MTLNYEEMDPGIRDVVKALNEAGFETTDSGDGSKAATDEDAFAFPHVAGAFRSGSHVHAIALEAAVDRIVEIIHDNDGRDWKCDASFGSDDHEWTWVAYVVQKDGEL